MAGASGQKRIAMMMKKEEEEEQEKEQENEKKKKKKGGTQLLSCWKGHHVCEENGDKREFTNHRV